MSQPRARTIQWHGANITKEEARRCSTAREGRVVTRLSGSESSDTPAAGTPALERHIATYVLDATTSASVSTGPGFLPGIHREHPPHRRGLRSSSRTARRYAHRFITRTAPTAISPAESWRPRVLEVFIDTPLDVCEQRDPQPLHEGARRRESAISLAFALSTRAREARARRVASGQRSRSRRGGDHYLRRRARPLEVVERVVIRSSVSTSVGWGLSQFFWCDSSVPTDSRSFASRREPLDLVCRSSRSRRAPASRSATHCQGAAKSSPRRSRSVSACRGRSRRLVLEGQRAASVRAYDSAM